MGAPRGRPVNAEEEEAAAAAAAGAFMFDSAADIGLRACEWLEGEVRRRERKEDEEK